MGRPRGRSDGRVRLMRMTYCRRSSGRQCVLVVLIILVHLAAVPGFLTAQQQQLAPDIRIDVAHGNLVGFAADDSYLIVEDSTSIKRYDLANRRFDQQLAFAVPEDSFAINSDGTRLARIGPTGVEVIDFESGDVQRAYRSPIKERDVFYQGAFSKDDDHLYINVSNYLYDADHYHASYVVNIVSGTWTRCSRAFGGLVDCESAASFDSTLATVDKTIADDLLSFAFSGDGSALLMIESRRKDASEMDVLHVLDT